jgi:hypothetical protein
MIVECNLEYDLKYIQSQLVLNSKHVLNIINDINKEMCFLPSNIRLCLPNETEQFNALNLLKERTGKIVSTNSHTFYTTNMNRKKIKIFTSVHIFPKDSFLTSIPLSNTGTLFLYTWLECNQLWFIDSYTIQDDILFEDNINYLNLYN